MLLFLITPGWIPIQNFPTQSQHNLFNTRIRHILIRKLHVYQNTLLFALKFHDIVLVNILLDFKLIMICTQCELSSYGDLGVGSDERSLSWCSRADQKTSYTITNSATAKLPYRWECANVSMIYDELLNVMIDCFSNISIWSMYCQMWQIVASFALPKADMSLHSDTQNCTRLVPRYMHLKWLLHTIIFELFYSELRVVVSNKNACTTCQ